MAPHPDTFKALSAITRSHLNHADPAFQAGPALENPGHSKPQIVFNFMSCPSYNHDIQSHTYMILSKYQKMKTVLKIKVAEKEK